MMTPMKLDAIAHILAEAGEMQSLALAAAVVIITFILLRRQYRRRTMGASPKQYTREIDTATNKSVTLKRDMERLLVELNELARQINGQIDTRYAKLEQTMSDADRRIKALRVLIRAAKTELKAVLDESGSPAAADDDLTLESLDITIGDEDEEPASMHTIDAADATDLSSENPPDAAEDVNRRIYELSDQGRRAIEIAQELDRNVGEVELILNLRNRAPDA